ncbi:major facilitator superfamily domain-containing protein [Scleroderma yunnanense]
MATENSPLLVGYTSQGDDVYSRFRTSQKRVIVLLVSFAALVPSFVSGSFVPSIPQIAKDFQVSGAAVSLAVSLSVFASAIGGLVWSAYSSFYGRRPTYLWGMPLMAIGSFGTAISTDLPSLLFWRFVQALGCSGGMPIGAAVIGDIYQVEERGSAMGSFFGASLFGLAIAPLTGGIAAEYWTWRGFQMALGVWGLVQMSLMHLLLPETTHPNTRGIEQCKEKGSIKRLVSVNPFGSLELLKSPNLLMVMMANTLALITDLVLLIPLSYTIGVRYNIKNDALIGACFLPNGLGNFVGAYIAGRLSDTMVKKWKKKRDGVWYPEDRLQGVYIGAFFLVPLSVGLVGLVATCIDSPIGLSICLMCLFTNGVGVDMVLTPIGSYAVDLMGSRGAEAIAAICALRSLLLAPLSALILPSVDVIGIAATNGIAALLAIIGYFCIWLTIRYGDRMRAYVNVGYAKTADQQPRSCGDAIHGPPE